jgi:hypothetical protein
MLVGRGMECERIEGLIEQARSGDGGLLVVSGEPGVGKSALLGHALEHAAEMRVLRATGVAWEAELAFSGLLELLGPILGHLNELPEPRDERWRVRWPSGRWRRSIASRSARLRWVCWRSRRPRDRC